MVQHLTNMPNARSHPSVVNFHCIGQRSAESNSPAHEGGDDDAPGCAAAVGVGLLAALLAAAAEPE